MDLMRLGYGAKSLFSSLFRKVSAYYTGFCGLYPTIELPGSCYFPFAVMLRLSDVFLLLHYAMADLRGDE